MRIRLLRQAAVMLAGLLLGSVASAASNPAIYAELGVGGYYRDLTHNTVVGAQVQKASTDVSWKHGRVGFQMSGDIGYRFWHNLSAEFGFFSYQNQELTFNSAYTYSGTAFSSDGTINFNSWGTYLAGKVEFQVDVDWLAYARLGVAYLRTKVSFNPISTSASTGSGHTWSPAMALGVSYAINPHWFTSFDYALYLGNGVKRDPYYAGNLSGNSIHVPPLQLFTLNVGYLFEI